MDELSASEALFGFIGWLTTRGERVVFSSRDDASIAAELVGEFCKANNLTEPRKDWYVGMIMPPSEQKVTGA